MDSWVTEMKCVNLFPQRLLEKINVLEKEVTICDWECHRLLQGPAIWINKLQPLCCGWIRYIFLISKSPKTF